MCCAKFCFVCRILSWGLVSSWTTAWEIPCGQFRTTFTPCSFQFLSNQLPENANQEMSFQFYEEDMDDLSKFETDFQYFWRRVKLQNCRWAFNKSWQTFRNFLFFSRKNFKFLGWTSKCFWTNFQFFLGWNFHLFWTHFQNFQMGFHFLTFKFSGTDFLFIFDKLSNFWELSNFWNRLRWTESGLPEKRTVLG